MRLTIEATPYSSTVGRGLVLKAPDGRAVGQIALLNSMEIADYKAYSGAVAAVLACQSVEVPDEVIRPHPAKVR